MDSNIFDLIKDANDITLKNHGDLITLERAVFLSWWCDKGDCAFCYMSTQKDKIKDPRKARRNVSNIYAEAEMCKRLDWNIEFLSGGYESFTTQEIKESQQRQNCRENVERHRRTEIRDRDERREKGAENAPDRPARLDRPHRLSVVGQISRRIFDEGRGDRSEQHKRKYEQDKAGSEGRPHKIISRYKSDNNVRHTEDHVPSDQRNDRDPDRREQDSPVEFPGIRIFIRCPASPDIADRHRDHDDADDHRPDHLGG